ncbi:hypothetical protein G6F56_004590 [Rhizopus delemar]|nr:hypothetical protein G6F56_004590 [Rhizopus delemar]
MYIYILVQFSKEPLVDSVEQIKPPDRIADDIPILEPTKSNLEPPEEDKKRPSWFYKSLIKPYKKKKQEDLYSRSSDVSSISSNHSIENSSIPLTPNTSNISTNRIEDDSITRIHTVNIASISNNTEKHDMMNRRYSFDSLQPLKKQQQMKLDNEDSHEIKEEQPNPFEESKTIFMFDYDSLPTEVKSIIDEYEQNGTATKKEMIVKANDVDDEEEEDEEDDEYESVDQKDVITGLVMEAISGKPRKIAIVSATATDTIEFKKLIQLSGDPDNGPLLDLRISMFGDEGDTHQDSIHELLCSVETHLASVETFESASRKFLDENEAILRTLDLPDIIIPPTSLSVMKPTKEHPEDLFERKHEEMCEIMKIFRKEIRGLQNSLKETEELVQNIQLEMGDTRDKMETYIKDIPESHYSALKKLEVDIESILSKRAKNPWLDTGYALLSYLLTLFALVVWTVIYILKWGKKVISFPNKLWAAYSDYAVERNKVVKKANIRLTAEDTSSGDDNLPRQQTLNYRHNRTSEK